ncbi:hypothetical protein [Hanstruepera flava]|uniref:hypothetical protein n=1 Tax=Hanstruepera flava TaxID=2930218 RepID=UPI002028E4C7|nr:hypothetical protein [Hanstruepera flava]
MRKLFWLLTLLICTTSCDDGDIITVEIEFGDTFKTCGELVFFQIKEFPHESLSLQITDPSVTLDDLLEVDDDGELVTDTLIVNINGDTNKFNYRTYNSDPTTLFCSPVPPSGIEIIEDLLSTEGEAGIYIFLLEDDEDGIPADMEDENLDEDNDPSTNPTDTDGDGIPDYLDFDDDGDNVLTSTELDLDPDLDGDGDPLTNPADTDMDGIPNYLDDDDDGDGVLTIDEENFSEDQNPANDFTDPSIADYLNPVVNTTVPATAYRPHVINQKFTVELEIKEVRLPTIDLNEFDFGTLEGDDRLESSRIVTPDF